jgi:hypothetical protein
VNIRHDLSDRGIVSLVRREADDGGPLAAVTIHDGEIMIGLLIHTEKQARAFRNAGRDALMALRQERELPVHDVLTDDRPTVRDVLIALHRDMACPKCGGEMILGADVCESCT